MTVGEYLKGLLYEKDISPAHLCQLIGINNKSVIYRLFNGYHSENKTKEIVNKIISAVDFTPEELSRINELVNQKKVSQFFCGTREILSRIYTDSDIQKSKNIKSECGMNTKLYISDIDNKELVEEIISMMHDNPDINILHYIHFAKHKLVTAYEMLMLIIMLQYKNYIPVIAEDKTISGICEITNSGKQIILREKRIIGNELLKLETVIPNAYSDYITTVNDKYMQRCEKIKEPVKRVVDYIKLVEDSLIFDRDLTFYSEGSPCFGNIPFDTICEMFRDINYLGFPENHQYVQQLIEVFRRRCDMFLNDPSAKKYFLFDTEHIKRMMCTGITFDHAKHFNPMTIKQRKEYFDWLIKMASSGDGKIKFRFLKNGVIRNPYVYGNDRMLCLYYSETGYMDDGVSIMLKNKAIFEIMDDFTQYVWESFTLSDKESINLLKEMAHKYIK